MSSIELWVTILSSLALWIWSEIHQRKFRPPGPIRLPIVGCLFEMVRQHKKPPFVFYKELFEKYGPYASMKAGVLDQIVVTDFVMMKEIMSSDLWQERYVPKYMEERSFFKPLGIIFNNGKEQAEMRRFTSKTLREFGFGKNMTMEEMIADELLSLKEQTNKIIAESGGTGKTVCMKNFFTISVLNVLWSMVGAVRFPHDDEKLTELCNLSCKLSHCHPIAANIMMAFPILQKILPRITENGKRTTRIVRDMHRFFRNELEQRRKLELYKVEQKDYIDVLLKEIDDHKGSPSQFTDEQFIVLTADLFQGGSETTANTLEFAFLYMILYPDIQKKVHEEIDAVIGRSRMPTLADRPTMPYTEATILEVQRLANIIPLIIRKCARDTKIGKYDSPKGTLAVCNIYGWNYNAAQWKEPEIFNPHHFLDRQGRLINENKITPFGMGKRVCLGETLGRCSLFLYFTTYMQSYQFELSADHAQPTLEPDIGFTLGPKPYHARISHRIS